jgi:hypothetical protein
VPVEQGFYLKVRWPMRKSSGQDLLYGKAENAVPCSTDYLPEEETMTTALAIPTIEEFMPHIEATMEELKKRLQAGGEEYGEEVIIVAGEMGAVSLCLHKTMRAKHKHETGQSLHQSMDTWLDLAGYAILELARRSYLGHEINGTYDRPKETISREEDGGYTLAEGTNGREPLPVSRGQVSPRAG